MIRGYDSGRSHLLPFEATQHTKKRQTHIYLGLPTCSKILLFCEQLCLLTQRRVFSPAGSFQCLHTLASIKIAKRRNLPSKRRNLPANRRLFLPGSELDSRRALFLRKSAFFSNRRNVFAVLGNGVNFTCWKVQDTFCYPCQVAYRKAVGVDGKDHLFEGLSIFLAEMPHLSSSSDSMRRENLLEKHRMLTFNPPYLCWRARTTT